jgi:hypothetical protein
MYQNRQLYAAHAARITWQRQITKPQGARAARGLLLGKMADTMMELDMEFSRNAGEIITSNAEE